MKDANQFIYFAKNSSFAQKHENKTMIHCVFTSAPTS